MSTITFFNELHDSIKKVPYNTESKTRVKVLDQDTGELINVTDSFYDDNSDEFLIEING